MRAAFSALDAALREPRSVCDSATCGSTNQTELIGVRGVKSKRKARKFRKAANLVVPFSQHPRFGL